MEEETTNPEKSVNEELSTAEKIYRAAEAAWKTLAAFLIFPTKEEAEKFRNAMHGKNFGKFVSLVQSKAGILYLKIGGHEIAADYYPGRKHIEKIKNFLTEQKEKSIDIAQQILMQIATIPITARIIRGKILYPEIEEMEKEIAELKEKLKGKDKQLRFSLDTWLYSMHGIESNLRHALPRIYAMKNEIGKE